MTSSIEHSGKPSISTARRRVLVPFDPVRSVDQVEVVRSVCQLDEVPASPDFFGQLVVDLEAQLPERADQPVAVIGRPAWCARRCGSDTTRARPVRASPPKFVCSAARRDDPASPGPLGRP